jgi:hypothetical protein
MLFATYNWANPIKATTSVLVPFNKIFIKFTARKPSDNFMATWVCYESKYFL